MGFCDKFSSKSVETVHILMEVVLSRFGYGQGFENDTLLPLCRGYMGLKSKLGFEKRITQVVSCINLAESLGMNNESRTLISQLYKSDPEWREHFESYLTSKSVN